MSTPTKELRVAALNEARLETLATIVTARETLDGAKERLRLIEAQLKIMTGLTDEVPEDGNQ
jgi:hypothetical protein